MLVPLVSALLLAAVGLVSAESEPKKPPTLPKKAPSPTVIPKAPEPVIMDRGYKWPEPELYIDGKPMKPTGAQEITQERQFHVVYPKPITLEDLLQPPPPKLTMAVPTEKSYVIENPQLDPTVVVCPPGPRPVPVDPTAPHGFLVKAAKTQVTKQ